jgi:hypothetical protein
MSHAVLAEFNAVTSGVRFSLGSFLCQEKFREDNDTRCHL